MALIKGGYYIKARKIQESKIAHCPPHVREIWDWLLKECNHKPKISSGRMIERGQCVRTYKDVQNGLHWMVGWRKQTYSKWDCEKAMKVLREATMITTEKTTRGMVITVLNYDYYQNPSNYESHEETDKKATRKPQSTDTINKNEKNERIYTKPPSAKAVSGFKDIKQLLDSPLKHLELIGYYLESTGKKFNTPEELTVTVKRWMRDASAIAKFSEDKINDAFDEAKNKYPDIWHLGTVLKILTK